MTVAGLTGREQAVLDWLGGAQPAMLQVLQQLVDTDSGSHDKAGVDAVVRQLREWLAAHGVEGRLHRNASAGDCLKAVVGSGERPVVLMGHCDTVFEAGTAARRPFRIDGDLAYGPGVADMKAGLVANAFVLAAFARAGLEVPLAGLFTADEEIASPASRPFIEAHVAGARAVLNAEPGRPSGNVVTGRKGAMFLDCQVTGIAAHSGVNHQDGASAIEALCRKVQAMHRLTDYEAGTTVNVGLIRGGSSVNTVAAQADASVDIRFRTHEALETVQARIDAILAADDVPGTCAHVRQRRFFLPLVQSEGSRRLFDAYAEAAAALGFDVAGEYSGGSADSGFTAAAGIPTLCSTGPVGGKVHTEGEWLQVGSLVPRAQAMALTALRLLR
ncbi:MAG TPA: M20 family metallopeptidase [Ramlibacter sp.]|nr:M20 family metallopeptidase [Ramlibacter sp.]